MPTVNRFSLRSLFGLILLAAVATLILMRLNAKAPYSGLSSDLGGGYGKAFHVRDNEGNDLGRFEVNITESMIAADPSWKPSLSNPPVSARQALSIADRFRKNRFSSSEQFDWSLLAVSLTPLDLENQKWCWVISFELVSKTGTISGITNEIDVFVMMDGSVIEPEDTSDFLNPLPSSK